MTPHRQASVYPAAINLLCRTMCLALLIALVGSLLGVRTGDAQIGGPVLTVYADPQAVSPGRQMTLTVVAFGAGSYADITIDIPSALTIVGDVNCVHSTLYCNGPSVSALDASTQRLSASAPGAVAGPDGPSSTTRVTVVLTVSVPASAVPGTEYEIVSSVQGLFNILDPTATTDKQVSIVVEVLDASGQFVALPPTAIPTPVVPATADQTKLRFYISDGDSYTPVILTPGEQHRFIVYQGFTSVEGSFTLRLILPKEMALSDEPHCVTSSQEACTSVLVEALGNGTTKIVVSGNTPVSEPVKLEFETQILPNALEISPSLITGRYVVTEGSTGELHEANLTSYLYFNGAGANTIPQSEGILRVVFNIDGNLSEFAGGCIALTQDGRWSEKYFICDNDIGAESPEYEYWTIPTDTSPVVGQIVVPLPTSTYSISVESLPPGFALQSSGESGEVTVRPEGTDYIFESTSP